LFATINGRLLRVIDGGAGEPAGRVEEIGGGGDAGEAFLDRRVHTAVVERLKQADLRSRPVLNERELNILKLMAEGFTNRQIAGKLYVSEGTIKDQLQKIMDKLGATNRVSALYIATKAHLI